MSENPNPCDLKLVILFDPREESCSIFNHNLSAENASQVLDELRQEGLFAFAVAQRSRHPAEYADDCTECRAELACTCPQDMS